MLSWFILPSPLSPWLLLLPLPTPRRRILHTFMPFHCQTFPRPQSVKCVVVLIFVVRISNSSVHQHASNRSESFDVLPPPYQSPCLQRCEIIQMIPQICSSFSIFRQCQCQQSDSSASAHFVPHFRTIERDQCLS